MAIFGKKKDKSGGGGSQSEAAQAGSPILDGTGRSPPQAMGSRDGHTVSNGAAAAGGALHSATGSFGSMGTAGGAPYVGAQGGSGAPGSMIPARGQPPGRGPMGGQPGAGQAMSMAGSVGPGSNMSAMMSQNGSMGPATGQQAMGQSLPSQVMGQGMPPQQAQQQQGMGMPPQGQPGAGGDPSSGFQFGGAASQGAAGSRQRKQSQDSSGGSHQQPGFGMSAMGAGSMNGAPGSGISGLPPTGMGPPISGPPGGAPGGPGAAPGTAPGGSSTRSGGVVYPWSQRTLAMNPPRFLDETRQAPPGALSPSPFPRYGHAANSAASASGEVYLFGGLVRESVKNDLYTVYVDRVVQPPVASPPSVPGGPAGINPGGGVNATLVQTTGEIPPPRVGHATVLVSNVLILWGGDTKVRADDKQDEGLYLLNLSTREWTRVRHSSDSPDAGPVGRYGHTVSIVGSRFYVFGGQVDGTFMNDMWSFDLNSLKGTPTWELLQPQGDLPPRRTGHASVTYKDRIFIFGGTDGQYHYNDTWCYDVASNTWKELSCIGYIPVPREGHATCLVDDVMYIFGGRGVDGKDLGDLASFKISNQRWYMFANMGPSPSGRSGHALTTFQNKVIVLGGESFTGGKPDDPSTVYVLDTGKIKYPPDNAAKGMSSSTGQRKSTVPGAAGAPTAAGGSSQPPPIMPPASELARSMSPPADDPRRAASPTLKSQRAGQNGLVSMMQSAAQQQQQPQQAPPQQQMQQQQSQQQLAQASVQPPTVAQQQQQQAPQVTQQSPMQGPPSQLSQAQGPSSSFADQGVARSQADAPSRAMSPTQQTVREQRAALLSGAAPAAGMAAVAAAPSMMAVSQAQQQQPLNARSMSPVAVVQQQQEPTVTQQPYAQDVQPYRVEPPQPIQQRNAPPREAPPQAYTVAPSVAQPRQAPQPPVQQIVDQPRDQPQVNASMSPPRQLAAVNGLPAASAPAVIPVSAPESTLAKTTPVTAATVAPASSGTAQELEAMRKREAWMRTALALAAKRGFVAPEQMELVNGTAGSSTSSAQVKIDDIDVGTHGSEKARIVQALMTLKTQLAGAQTTIAQQAKGEAERMADVERARSAALEEAAFYRAKMQALEAKDSSEVSRLERERTGQFERQLSASLRNAMGLLQQYAAGTSLPDSAEGDVATSSRVRQLEAQVATHQRELQDAEARHKDASSRAEARIREHTTRAEQLSREVANGSAAGTRSASVDAELQQLQRRAANAERELAEATASHRERIATLESDYNTAVSYVKGTEKMLRRMKDELLNFKTQNANLQAEVAALRSGTAPAGEAASEAAKDIEALRTRLVDVTHQSEEVAAENRELERRLAAIVNEQKDNHDRTRDLADTHADTTRKRNELEGDVSRLEAEVNSLRRELQEAQTVNQHLNRSGSAAGQASMARDYGSMHASNEQLKSENASLAQRLQDTEDKFQLLLGRMESSHGADEEAARDSQAFSITSELDAWEKGQGQAEQQQQQQPYVQ